MYFEKIPRENRPEASCFMRRHNSPFYDVTGKGARNCSKKCYVTCVILENYWNGFMKGTIMWWILIFTGFLRNFTCPCMIEWRIFMHTIRQAYIVLNYVWKAYHNRTFWIITITIVNFLRSLFLCLVYYHKFVILCCIHVLLTQFALTRASCVYAL